MRYSLWSKAKKRQKGQSKATIEKGNETEIEGRNRNTTRGKDTIMTDEMVDVMEAGVTVENMVCLFSMIFPINSLWVAFQAPDNLSEYWQIFFLRLFKQILALLMNFLLKHSIVWPSLSLAYLAVSRHIIVYLLYCIYCVIFIVIIICTYIYMI